MASQHSAFYLKVRRLLRNQFTRAAILILLVLVTVYTFTPRRLYKDTSENVPALVPKELGSTGRNAALKYDDEAVESVKVQPVVGKVHALFGEPNPMYERALQLHKVHSELMGHPMFVLREKLLSGLWSKPAFILSVMLQELTKPEDERLQWLLYDSALQIQHL